MTAVLAGLGTALPPRVVDNHELAARLDTSDEWIRARTGIARRHVVEPGASTVSLAVEAGAHALKSADLRTVGAVVLATTTPDHPCPASAPEVASRLGLPKVAALDVGAVCAGFLYALATAAGLIETKIAADVLVIGADTFSTVVDPTDRDAAVIFGDGAGAVVLRAGDPTEPGALGPFNLGSDGDLADLITIPAGGSKQRASGVPAPPRDHYFTMQGRRCFRLAVERMADSARAALKAATWHPEDIDLVIPHQANHRILTTLADHLDLPKEKIVSNISQVGNTAAASIPLAMAEATKTRNLKKEDKILLTAFGGGLTWASTTLTWPEITPQTTIDSQNNHTA